MLKKRFKRIFMAETQLTIEDFGKKLGWVEEEFEETNEVYVKTNYPEPHKKYRIVYESFSLSMEETYFWILDHLKYQLSFPNIDKITDIFSSSENSSFFGQSAQRLGLQQDKVQTILATLGKMTKDLFALVRELRIIDERLEAYNAWDKQHSKAADVTLKEIFINLVENAGGQMKTSSVYGLAQSLGYATLPDWFFNTKVFDKSELDSIVDKIPTNANLKNVLRRKLFEFIVWKEQTHKEMTNRRKFNLHYLRQHWGVIKMYMGWLKPYLRNIKRLTMNEQQIMSPEIVTAFETASLEIELLAYDNTKIKKGKASPCILVTFKYFVKPSLSYQQPESYQRGAIHVGKVDISFRSYGWDAKDIETYKKYREKEEMELLGVIDASLKAAMDALSEDLEKYLAEAGEEEFKKKTTEDEKKDRRTAIQKWLNVSTVEEHQKVDILEPFKGVFMGFGEILGAFLPAQEVKGPKTTSSPEKEKSGAGASKLMWLLLKNYKKAHQLLTW
jgi:hypothetical protein